MSRQSRRRRAVEKDLRKMRRECDRLIEMTYESHAVDPYTDDVKHRIRTIANQMPRSVVSAVGQMAHPATCGLLRAAPKPQEGLLITSHIAGQDSESN